MEKRFLPIEGFHCTLTGGTTSYWNTGNLSIEKDLNSDLESEFLMVGSLLDNEDNTPIESIDYTINFCGRRGDRINAITAIKDAVMREVAAQCDLPCHVLHWQLSVSLIAEY